MKDKMYYIAKSLHIAGLKQTKRKTPLYWQAWYGGTLVEENNSISLLRHKYKSWGKAITYKPVY